jgi:hypothetical protein
MGETLKITKIRVAFLVLVIVAFSVVAGIFYVIRLQHVSSVPYTIIIDGNTYSDRPTPYGHFEVRFADGSFSTTYWLLTPNETLPSNSVTFAAATPPEGDAVIYGEMYSTIPTNYTEFTMPPSTEQYWTLYDGQPIPINAAVVAR